jgi:hypothetical protein
MTHWTRRSVVGAGLAAPLLSAAACTDNAQGVASAAELLRRPLNTSAEDPIPDLVRFATLAANSHNTQPWLFERTPTGIAILPDVARRCPAVDPDDHHVFATLGCAAENIAIAAPSLGRAAEVVFEAEAKRVNIVLTPSTLSAHPLVDAIPRRQCTRSVYNGQLIPTEQLTLLEAAGAVEGVDIRLFTERAMIDRIRDTVIDANRAQMQDQAFVAELKAWIRFNERSALATQDGLFAACSGNPTLPDWLAGALFPMVFTIESETKKYREQMASTPGVAVFTAASEDPTHWMRTGRAYQRFALQATALGIKHAFINQPAEVPASRAPLADLLGMPGKRVDLLVRFGYAPDLPFSLRRPTQAVLRA